MVGRRRPSVQRIKQPDFDRCYVLRIDASDKCIGAVLLQEYDGERFLVAYTRKKLNPTQAVYAIVERGNCLGIVWALEKFTTYLCGSTFLNQTDHQPLTFIRTTRLTNPRLIRWSLKLQLNQLKIEAIPGNENVSADFLSRANK